MPDRKKPFRWRFFGSLICSVCVGAAVGSQMIAPFVERFGDEDGTRGGIAIGGFVGIVAYLALLRRRSDIRKTVSTRSPVSRFAFSLHSCLLAILGLLFIAAGARTLCTVAFAIDQEYLHWNSDGRDIVFGFDGLSTASNIGLLFFFGMTGLLLGAVCLWVSDEHRSQDGLER